MHSTAQVTRMELHHIKGIGPAKQTKLQDAGIDSVEALARADVAEVAAKSGLSEAQVKEFKEKAIGLNLLEDVRGMGPQTVVVLAKAGITSLKDLYDASTERIAKEAQVAKEHALQWQEEAQKLAEHVREEAKTPEGRRKLLKEAADASKVAAGKTQEAVVALYHKAREDGEAAIQKAQQLRETAPAQLQELRETAEKALRDAEAKVKELQDKAPDAVQEWRGKAETAVQEANRVVVELRDKTEQFVKTETEKVKAANEGLLTRIKARFQRKVA